MPPIIVSTEVQRSADDVFAYATDPTHFSEWQKGVVNGHMEQPSIPSVGTRCVTLRRIGFADRPSTSESNQSLVRVVTRPATGDRRESAVRPNRAAEQRRGSADLMLIRGCFGS